MGNASSSFFDELRLRLFQKASATTQPQKLNASRLKVQNVDSADGDDDDVCSGDGGGDGGGSSVICYTNNIKKSNSNDKNNIVTSASSTTVDFISNLGSNSEI